jgi:DNA-binding transcriptional MerR regulator
MSAALTEYLTLGAVANRLGCQPWQVRRLFERGLLPEPRRVATYRVVAEEDLPAVEKALKEAGYIPAEGGDHGA